MVVSIIDVYKFSFTESMHFFFNSLKHDRSPLSLESGQLSQEFRPPTLVTQFLHW